MRIIFTDLMVPDDSSFSNDSTVSSLPDADALTPRSDPALLSLNTVCLAYEPDAPVVPNLSFQVGKNEIACLLGPSGCGKTTVLKAIAGFVPLHSGSIVLNDLMVSSANQSIAPEKRGIGVVFQDYALFPHLTISENIGFGLRRLSARERALRLQAMLDLVGLNAHAKKYPHELSGGQQQRVALARALAPRPSLLLMDEPFSNLDIELRERLSMEVREILKASATSAILVTHDQHEAFAMADVIGVLHHGVLQQWDKPYNLYHRPNSRFVADFVGAGTFVPAQLHMHDSRPCFRMALGCLDARGYEAWPIGKEVELLLRPDDVLHDDASTVTATVVRKAFRGAEFLYTLKLDSADEVLSLVPSHHNHAVGERIGIRLDADHVIAFGRT